MITSDLMQYELFRDGNVKIGILPECTSCKITSYGPESKDKFWALHGKSFRNLMITGHLIQYGFSAMEMWKLGSSQNKLATRL